MTYSYLFIIFLATPSDVTASTSTDTLTDHHHHLRPKCEYFNDLHTIIFLALHNHSSDQRYSHLYNLQAKKCNVGKYALHGIVGTRQYAVDPTDVDVVEYVRNNVDDVRHHLNNAIRKHRSVKWYSTIDISFQRTTSDGDVQHTTARFSTQPNVISDTSDVSVDRIAGEFLSWIENFNRRGSNWIVESVLHFHITFAPFRPTQGSSFIFTPREIAVKHAIINIQNYDDHLCFLWSILAALYSVRHEQHPSHQYHYKPYLSKLNVTDLSFPLPVKDVAKFEQLNPDIAVSVLVYRERELIPFYVSPRRDRKHHSTFTFVR